MPINPPDKRQAPRDFSVQPELVNSQPPRIPDYELLQRIGGGSYGEVWLARNIFGEWRAVKIVYRSRFEHDRPYEREFGGIRKFEPISRSHESQVDILHVGRNDEAGYFYYVMELADDANASVGAEVTRLTSKSDQSLLTSAPTYHPRTLKHDLHERIRLPVNECIEIGLALCRALEHLHSHGLVHRDIKPSNIIFVNGVPKLADIGLVASMDATMSFVGTSGFVPPEGPGTPQGDIYSLGKVLYEMAMGRDRMEFPKLPADLAESSNARQLLELNAIILKASHHDPAQRYESAKDMAAELGLLKRGSSVKEERRNSRRKKLGRRIAIVGICLALAAVPGTVLWRQHSAEKQRRTKEAEMLVREGWEQVKFETKDSIARATQLFNQALVVDPAYSPAYCGLVQCYLSSSDWHMPSKQMFSEARRAASRAVELAPRSAPAHISMAQVKLLYNWDWRGAEAECRQALKLQRDSVAALNNLAWCLRATGRLTEAHEVQARAYSLSPTNINALSGMISQYFQERDYARAMEFANLLRSIMPETIIGYVGIGTVALERGAYDEAVAAFEKARALDDGPDLVACHGYALAVAGRTNEARTVLTELRLTARTRYVSPYFEACLYSGLRDRAETLRCLEAAFEERSVNLVSFSVRGLTVDPRFDWLRDEPAFEALIRRMGLEPRTRTR